jgi:hypothetical protein
LTLHGFGCGAAALLLVVLPSTGLPGCAVRPTRSVKSVSPSDAASAGVAALDVHVDQVVSGGRWCNERGEGFYRVVAYGGGFEAIYHHLYVQLVRVDVDAQTLAGIATFPVEETRDASMVVTDLMLVGAAERACGDAIVTARVLRRTADGEVVQRMRMTIDATGHYAVSFRAP